MARQENHKTSYRKLGLVGKKTFSVSLPIAIVKQLGWKKADILLVRRQAGRVVIEKEDKK